MSRQQLRLLQLCALILTFLSQHHRKYTTSATPNPPLIHPPEEPPPTAATMPTQWVDWSKTTRSKDYRGSGSFATFLIIGRTPAPLPPQPSQN